jgi:hypothetical protein
VFQLIIERVGGFSAASRIYIRSLVNRSRSRAAQIFAFFGTRIMEQSRKNHWQDFHLKIVMFDFLGFEGEGI